MSEKPADRVDRFLWRVRRGLHRFQALWYRVCAVYLLLLVPVVLFRLSVAKQRPPEAVAIAAVLLILLPIEARWAWRHGGRLLREEER